MTVTYNPNHISSVADQGSNCFLKDAQGDKIISLDHAAIAFREL